MILESLIDQFRQRFQLEKRAKVCLWFDEKREFARLLPALRERLEGDANASFRLLEYDAALHHGQIWLKQRLHRESVEARAAGGAARRFVVYLPLSEDRLDFPDEDGRDHLELLVEYRLPGTLWRVNGKKPTLFAFLKQAGVSLPEAPREQRRLTDGGAESLLAKYVARHLGRPREFWQTTITPELAKGRLLGDADQTILDLAVDPEGAWASLREKGLLGELLESVEERYGFASAASGPATWLRELVAFLALCEAFAGFGRRSDFPFAARLPGTEQQDAAVRLLRRWLRDVESRPAWDRLILEVEATIDLSAWATGAEGQCFGLPHLVLQRWERAAADFVKAANKVSTTASYFASHANAIRQEWEFARASHLSCGAWELLERTGRFLTACGKACSAVTSTDDGNALVNLYVELAPAVDGEHLGIRRLAQDHELPAAARVVDRAYSEYTAALNQRFCTWLSVQGAAAAVHLPTPTARLEQAIWHAKGRRAVLIVDGLRFDCAHALMAALQGLDVTVEPLRAILPTVTAVGMTALLPLAADAVTLEVVGNALHPKRAGNDLVQRQARIGLLTAFGADCRSIEAIEGAGHKPANLGELLVVIGHDDLDTIGHGDGASLIRHLDLEIKRLARLVRALHRWGYPEVHVVTDHGFVLVDEEMLPPTVEVDPAWCRVVKERFALVPAGAHLPLLSVPCEWNAELRVAFPPGTAFFKAEKSFSHGGATLQELIVPHLVSRSAAPAAKKPRVEVVLASPTLMRSAVKVTLRSVLTADAAPRQMDLFAAPGRTLALDVVRALAGGQRVSVLAGGEPKLVELAGSGEPEVSVVLFFHTALSFAKGEQLLLDIRDTQSLEQFPPKGITLTVGRDL